MPNCIAICWTIMGAIAPPTVVKYFGYIRTYIRTFCEKLMLNNNNYSRICQNHPYTLI